MVAQTDQQEDANQENDNRDADSGAGKKFKMEMPLTKKPVADAAEDRPSAAL
jgi:hypothetical protein